MCKQLEMFENEGYRPGFAPIEREQRVMHQSLNEVKSAPVSDFKPVGGIVCRSGGEQAERLIRLLSDGYCHTVVEIIRRLNIGDPRSVIRDIRKAGIEVLDKWAVSESGNRYKYYWIKKKK